MSQSNYMGSYRSNNNSVNKDKIEPLENNKNNSQNFNENYLPQDAN
jgi:hypothetical protein